MHRTLARLTFAAILGSTALTVHATPLCDGPGDRHLSYDGIEAATTSGESKARLDARIERVLSHYARTSLAPLWSCVEAGGTIRAPECADLAADLGRPTAENPLPLSANGDAILDLRSGFQRLSNVLLARVALGCDIDPRLEATFANPDNRPWSPPGTDLVPSPIASRPDVGEDGNADYDFQLMTLIRLVYVAHRDHPGTLRPETIRSLVDQMLDQRGRNRDTTYTLSVLGGLFEVQVGDTENHVLMTETARYLTNQLVGELGLPCQAEDCDNGVNGNDDWMLRHMQGFVEELFYEYNSRPYQGYALQAFDLLANYADDEEVRMAARIVLDTVSAWTAMQSNQLRRAPPFRRQESFVDLFPLADGSPSPNREAGIFSAQDGEYYRLSLLAGSYGALDENDAEPPRYTITSANRWSRSQGDMPLFSAVSTYRLPEPILELLFPVGEVDRYLVSKHDAVEIYAQTATATISAGSHPVRAELPSLVVAGNSIDDFTDRIVATGLLDDVLEGERGWARPTFVIPTGEPSGRHIDMLRFEGQARPTEPRTQADSFENTCVAPGFACGLELQLGDVLEPLVASCAPPECVRDGDWLLLDLTTGRAGWPRYGFFMAVHERSCAGTACEGIAENYGLIEIAEASGATSFASFRESVRENNGSLALTPDEGHSYRTVAGRRIEFRVRPPDGEASIAAIDDVRYPGTYADWPLARGNVVRSTTPGRVTIDSPSAGQRLILDLTNDEAGRPRPRRLETAMPTVRWEAPTDTALGDPSGRFFDQSSSLAPSGSIQSVGVSAGDGCVSGLAVEWSNGLRSTPGSPIVTESLELGRGEHVDSVRLARADGSDELRFLALTTNRGRSLEAGTTDGSSALQVLSAGPDEQLGGFRGFAGECLGHVDVAWLAFEPPPAAPRQRSGSSCALTSAQAPGWDALLLVLVTGALAIARARPIRRQLVFRAK